MAQSPLATAADYAEAMFVARRAKTFLVMALVGVLGLQMALFFVARYTRALEVLGVDGSAAAVAAPTTQAAEAGSPQAEGRLRYRAQVLEWLVRILFFAGTLLVWVLAAVLLLILQIMLVGRLIGVASVTSAFLWHVGVVVLLFPWQLALDSPTLATADFRFPGVLYTFTELAASARFPTSDLNFAILKWARFVGFPVVAIILLLAVHLKSRRGMRQALGESEIEIVTDTQPPLPPTERPGL